jgi:cation diffusion facilitator family transporter
MYTRHTQGSWSHMSASAELSEQVRPPSRARAAAVSIASNACLIILKLVAGVLTGSVSILTEAIHSGVDLIASIIAFVSVRQAEQPADSSHRYGHEKFENVASGVEAVLILLGAGLIVYAAVQSLIAGPSVNHIGIGVAVIVFTTVVNLLVSRYLFRRAKATDSPALEGDALHLRADSWTSLGVLGGLVLIHFTGWEWVDPVIALVIACAIVVTGIRLALRSWRVLVDEALPENELAQIHGIVNAFGDRGIVGYHKLRTRRAGARRYIDMHVQFSSGTTLEQAHKTAHELQDAISLRLRGADVLIQLEPEDRVESGTEIRRMRQNQQAET